MGLLLSVLVGCVGVLELFACLRHVSDGVLISINAPQTPCLSYHEATCDTLSIHDSICSFSHTSDANLPRAAKHKLENLHEYSLRIRSELRSRDKNFECNTLSECSTRDFLGGGSRPDSRLSPDFNLLVEDSEARSGEFDDEDDDEYGGESFEENVDVTRAEGSSMDRPLSLAPAPDKYVRVPTPIPFGIDDELSPSESSSEEGTSFDNDSGNEAPTMQAFDKIPTIQRQNDSASEVSSVDESEQVARKYLKKPFRKSHSRSPDISSKPQTPSTQRDHVKSVEGDVDASVTPEDLPRAADKPVSQKKRSGKSSTTIVRKSTRLKSRNAEVSKSAENLSARNSKRRREPERRKSDISVQTTRNNLRDESTNTSPQGSPTLSRSDSRKSVSVEVQTSFEEKLPDDEEALDDLESSVLGLSESKRDLTSRERIGKKSFKNRRFKPTPRGQVDEDVQTANNQASKIVQKPVKDKSELLRISSFEDAELEDYERLRSLLGERDSRSSLEDDEDYADAEDVSACTGPIQYSIPDPERNNAFWVILLKKGACPPSLSLDTLTPLRLLTILTIYVLLVTRDTSRSLASLVYLDLFSIGTRSTRALLPLEKSAD